MIRIEHLSKRYGRRVALSDVSFELRAGEITLLLGANGAGKSTLLRCLLGITDYEGSITVAGLSPLQQGCAVRSLIGYMAQTGGLHHHLTVDETMRLYAEIRDVAAERAATLIEEAGLAEHRSEKVGDLSGGMRQRLGFALALLTDPQILVLDEPTAGVDIELRQQLWDYVRGLNKQGVTVVLTTHYLEEAEQLCDRIAIINHGKLIANEPTRELVAKAQDKAVVVTVDRDLTEAPTAACFERIAVTGERTIEIGYRKDRVNAGDVLDALQKEGFGIVDVSTRDPDLEDVFLSLTREGA